jgi:threonine/homoserine/homoserine lactone efflux protein
MIGVFLVSLLTAFSGAIVPGTLFALVINQALLTGWMAGVWIITGHALAELALLVALRVGLGAFLRRKAVTRVIGLVGGAVLLYFAWSMVDLAHHGSLRTAGDEHAAAMSVGVLILQGAAVSVLNPYWHLWWATVGVGLVATQSARHGGNAWPTFFTGHILADYLWYVAISVLVALGGKAVDPAVHRIIILVCAGFIAVMGLSFLLAPLRETLRPQPAPIAEET